MTLPSEQCHTVWIRVQSPPAVIKRFNFSLLFVSRTIEDLYEELVTQGIIIRPPPTRLADYEGEYSYLGTTLRQANIEPMPSLSDVRRLVTEFGILPLGMGNIHQYWQVSIASCWTLLGCKFSSDMAQLLGMTVWGIIFLSSSNEQACQCQTQCFCMHRTHWGHCACWRPHIHLFIRHGLTASGVAAWITRNSSSSI